VLSKNFEDATLGRADDLKKRHCLHKPRPRSRQTIHAADLDTKMSKVPGE